MWSTPSRFSEASQAWRTYSGLPLRDQRFGSALVRMLANFVAASANRLADQLLVVADSVGVRRIQKRDAQIECAQNRCGGFFVIPLAVEVAHPHAAEPHAGDDRALRTKFHFFHSHKPSDDFSAPLVSFFFWRLCSPVQFASLNIMRRGSRGRRPSLR